MYDDWYSNAPMAQDEIQKNIEDNLKMVVETQKLLIHTLNDRIDNTNEILGKLRCLAQNTYVTTEEAAASKEIYRMLLVGDNEGLQNYFAGKKGDEAVQELVVLLYAILSGNTPI